MNAKRKRITETTVLKTSASSGRSTRSGACDSPEDICSVDVDPLDSSDIFVGIPEPRIKTEEHFSFEDHQLLPFEDHLKELKAVFTECAVPDKTSGKILSVLHSFDPRYPIPTPVVARVIEQEAKSPSPPLYPPPDKASTPETSNMNESDMEKALEKVLKRVFGKIEKRLDTLQNSIDEIQSLISTRGSSAGADPGPLASDRSLLVLPLTMKDMTRLETAEEDSDIRKLFVKALIDRKNKPKKFSKLFTDNALRMYNWTGKNKRAISTSEIFKLIKVYWFDNDEDRLQMFILCEFKRLHNRVSKKMSRSANQSNSSPAEEKKE